MNFEVDKHDKLIVGFLIVFIVGILLNYAVHGARIGTNVTLLGISGLLLVDYLKNQK